MGLCCCGVVLLDRSCWVYVVVVLYCWIGDVGCCGVVLLDRRCWVLWCCVVG